MKRDVFMYIPFLLALFSKQKIYTCDYTHNCYLKLTLRKIANISTKATTSAIVILSYLFRVHLSCIQKLTANNNIK